MDQDWLLPCIDRDRCRGHGLCVQGCPTEAIALQSQGPVFVRPDLCSYCGDCEERCPEGAISLAYEIR